MAVIPCSAKKPWMYCDPEHFNNRSKGIGIIARCSLFVIPKHPRAFLHSCAKPYTAAKQRARKLPSWSCLLLPNGLPRISLQTLPANLGYRNVRDTSLTHFSMKARCCPKHEANTERSLFSSCPKLCCSANSLGRAQPTCLT